ncbi:hypothetical protein [Rhodovibrio salinarum]|uniref:DUF340 domain-containing protein n=1 Tax=Rhodovibrio salinarum TaxID=1087 RepID=A0A934QI17_9PROT|nr:hypothetical protein [Rhodovibrio salinarum]MBK1697371.1 hypothetical protein [Rhodovibrio salinarum]
MSAVTRPHIDLADHAAVLFVVSALCLVGNTVGPGNPIVGGLIGIAILYAIVMAGLALAKWVPFYLPSVAWISIVGIVITLPGVPGQEWIVAQTGNVNFLILATPCLAYAGLAIAREEIEIAKTSGWRIALVAVFVLAGTYLGSALIADLVLSLQGA